MSKQYIDTKSVKSNLDSLLSQLTFKEDKIKEKIEYTIRNENTFCIWSTVSIVK